MPSLTKVLHHLRKRDFGPVLQERMFFAAFKSWLERIRSSLEPFVGPLVLRCLLFIWKRVRLDVSESYTTRSKDGTARTISLPVSLLDRDGNRRFSKLAEMVKSFRHLSGDEWKCRHSFLWNGISGDRAYNITYYVNVNKSSERMKPNLITSRGNVEEEHLWE